MTTTKNYVLRTNGTATPWFYTSKGTFSEDLSQALVAPKLNLQLIRSTLKGVALVIKELSNLNEDDERIAAA